MTLALSDLTRPEAVLAALDEYERVGQTEFLAGHGFGRASSYLVRHPRTGNWADSKAIAGVALAYQYPGSGGLRSGAFSGGEATVQRRLELLGFEVQRISQIHGQEWRQAEVALIVADYLAMLTSELTGQRFNKAEHRRRLLEHLPGRNHSSVEFKHANISAVLLELGYPYLKGYRPRNNFQRSLLVPEVTAQVSRHGLLDEAALAAVQRPAVPPDFEDFHSVRTEAPRSDFTAKERNPDYFRPPIQRDYAAREAQNRSLGQAGEEFALRFERWRLAELGVAQLADQVAHVSVIEGDGLGYDIRSFELDGSPRFIEVKTTSFGDRTPFFVSANELRFAIDHQAQYRLYRLFDFRSSPRLFELAGSLDRHCQLDPSTYRASFG